MSGLEHELYHYVVVGKLSWMWMAFFTVQAPALVAERWLVRRLHRRVRLWRPVQSMAVLLFLGVTSEAWFWPVFDQPEVQAALLRGRAV
jgi:hypothetical protein